MAQTANQQAAAQAVAARMAYLEWSNAALVAAAGVDPGTIGDFLNGQRWPKTGTQGKIERAIGWPPGTLRAVGFGHQEPPAPEWSVGPSGDDPAIEDEPEELLYRRPEGISDQEWERVKAESRRFIEWQIEQAARER